MSNSIPPRGSRATVAGREEESTAASIEHETETWLRISTRRVIALFIGALARCHGWKKISIISPWISDFNETAGMSFRQFLKRLHDDNATAYVVSRPPLEDWHRTALDKIASTGRANVALVPSLHTKLFCATTDQGSFAMLGSANLTGQSLTNREIGVLLLASSGGAKIVRGLEYEAAEIYRSPDRKIYCKLKF